MCKKLKSRNTLIEYYNHNIYNTHNGINSIDMNNNGILKFPDREKGFIWKKRDESGKWIEVNEDGSAISQDGDTGDIREDRSVSSVCESASVKGKKVKKQRKEKLQGQVTGIRFSKEMLEDLDDFIIWKSYTGRVHRTRTDVIAEALELLMKKNPGFADYRKRRDP